MKFSECWLREWVNPTVPIEELARQLAMTGLEVETITPVAGDFSGVLIGQVNKVEPHPNADRLRVCEVEISQTAPLTIVCGAANVRKGLKVAVATVGAVLPGGHLIQSAKLRGVLSQGMICSAAELELQEHSEGIMELPLEAPVGENFRHWLQLDDYIMDVHLTPNRGDCLSVMGMAREVAVLNNLTPLNPPLSGGQHITIRGTQEVSPPDKGDTGGFSIKVQADAACPRYVGRIIRGINSQAKIPLVIAERLRRSGLRCLHPIVDIANYVMLELGQPLHAFDLAKLSGPLCVRFAQAGEEIILLNEQKLLLDEKTVVIADDKQPQALAGIMGSQASAVSATTQNIWLESAFFSPLAMVGQARRYGLNTDSAYRFERGVDPELPAIALERATQLILEIAGGRPEPLVEYTAASYLPQPAIILLRSAQVERVLGISIASKQIETILQQLGMKIAAAEAADTWWVTPPTYRYDIALEADLIEELARIYGYANIPAAQSMMAANFMPQPETKITSTHWRQALLEHGYCEAITYSFTTPVLQQLIDPQQEAMVLANPISADLSVMRTSLWPGLLTAVSYNQNRQQSRIRLFEMGLRFVPQAEKILQQTVLAGVIAGPLYPQQWSSPSHPIDFFDVKNDLEALLALTGQSEAFVFQPAEHPALHPSQASAILYRGKKIGYIGAVHPTIAQTLGLLGPVYLFELATDELIAKKLPRFAEFSKFPSIRRDISFWVDNAIPVQRILDAIRQHAGEWLADLVLFDVYQGKGADADKRSLALGLVLQHPTRTLMDAEADEIMAKVVVILKEFFTIKLRE